jgi:hypothetical protein
MNTKLTLSIDKQVIAQAKKYAALQGRSLSDLIENYLKVVIKDPNDEKPDSESDELTPIVKSLKGAFKAPENFDYKKALSEILKEKYGKG